MMANCSHANVSLEDLKNLQRFGETLSGIGSVALLPLLLTKLIVPKFRLFPSRLSTLFVLCSLGLNFTILAGHSQDWAQLWRDKLEKKPSTTFCQVQGIFFQFFAAAEILLWFCIALSMYLILVKKKSFEELSAYELRFHLGWFGGALAMTVIPSVLHPAVPQLGTSYCWLTEKDSFLYQISFLHAEMFVALFVGSTFVYRVVQKLYKVSDTGDDDFVSLVRNYVLRHTLFLLGFASVFLILVVFVTNQILELHNVWCVTLPMAYLHSAASSGSAIVASIVLSRVEYFKAARDHCCQRKQGDAAYLLEETTQDDSDDGF